MTKQGNSYIIKGNDLIIRVMDLNIFTPFKKSGIDFIIVGLGNPGAQYSGTRHNVGFAAIDFIASKLGVTIKKAKFTSYYEKCILSGKNILLVKPLTYMNNSGQAVAAIARFYKIQPENIIVLVDDVSLAAGSLRIRKKGSAGGHNGLKSINECLESENYTRVKIGVGQKPVPEMDLADWVLTAPSQVDAKKIEARFDDIYKAVGLAVDGKIDTAMNEFNGTNV